MESLLVCTCDHALEWHLETGCQYKRGSVCRCGLSRATVVDLAIERERQERQEFSAQAGALPG
jgi:hypothetical protein